MGKVRKVLVAERDKPEAAAATGTASQAAFPAGRDL